MQHVYGINKGALGVLSVGMNSYKSKKYCVRQTIRRNQEQRIIFVGLEAVSCLKI
jgi:hypothetical protein